MNAVPKRQFYLREFKAISMAISQYEDLNLLIDHFVEGLSLTFKVKGAAILLYDEFEQQLFRVGSFGLSEAYLNKGPIAFVDDKEDAFTKGKPVFIHDLATDPRVQYPKAAREEGITALLSFPIKCRQAVVGVARIYHHAPIELHEDDIGSISLLLQQLGLVIENNGLKNFVELIHSAMAGLPARLRKG